LEEYGGIRFSYQRYITVKEVSMSEYKKVIFLNLSNLHKKNLNKGCSLIIYLFIVFYSSMTFADNNITWLDDTLSTGLTRILRDDARDLIYLADTGSSRLVVINSKTLKVILRLPIQSSFKDMAISKDNNILAIAGGTLFLVDLNTFELRKLSTDLDVSSVAFDHNGDLMLLTAATRTYIYHYDPDKETVIKSFGVGSSLTSTIYRAVYLKTDGSGNIMYVSAPSADTFYKFDISGDTPILLAENDDREYMVDFAISPLLSEIYAFYSFGYGIEIINSNTLSSSQFLLTGEYQVGVVTDPGGYNIFGVDKKLPNGTLYQYDTIKRELSFQYNLSTEIDDGMAQRRGLAVDRSGQRAFIIHGGYPYNDDEAHLKVQVVELNVLLKMTLPENVDEGDGNLENGAKISVLNAPSEDMIIYLESNDTTELQVPESVTILAGQTSAFFNITIVDDTILDGTKQVTIKADATGYNSTLGSINVNDNETATLTLNLPNNVTEGDGLLVGQGVISVDKPVDENVVVNLNLNNIIDFVLPPKVIIPVGQTSTTFYILIPDDTEIEGTEEVTIISHVEGWTDNQKKIVISDNEVAELSISTDATFSEGDGTITDTGIVTISGALSNDLEVSLYSSDTTEITVPSSVTIPSGKFSTTFDITVINDTEKDGLQAVTLSASAEGFPDHSFDTAVTDNDNIVWLDDTFSTSLTCILRDDKRNIIYLADAGNKQLVLIDSLSLNVVRRISINSMFRDMAISKDNRTMAIAGETLFLVDLETYEKRQLTTTLDVVSVDFDHRGHLMLTTTEYWGNIYQYNPDTETVVRSFSPGSFYRYGLLKTDDDGDILYVAERLSPVSLYRYDISGDTPVLLAEDDHGELGSTLGDFVLAPNRDEIYMANGGGSGLLTLESNTIDVIKIYTIGDHMGGVAADPGGDYIYATPSSRINAIYQFGAPQQKSALHYNLLSQNSSYGVPTSRGIAVDRTGRKAFVINDGYDKYKVQVVELYLPFDNDDDGLSDQVEVTGCTDPHDKDTDDDGILDGIEDTNHNGKYDSSETNPYMEDTDGDGIQDGIEDANKNGTVNTGETDPRDSDTDNDELLDGQEDANHNGYLDVGETNPLNADTDNDGMLDGWEVQYELDPLVNDANDDADGDGYSNLKEYKRKTIPNDYNSQPSKGMPWLPLLLGE
jgi:hypothetical protein